MPLTGRVQQGPALSPTAFRWGVSVISEGLHRPHSHPAHFITGTSSTAFAIFFSQQLEPPPPGDEGRGGSERAGWPLRAHGQSRNRGRSGRSQGVQRLEVGWEVSCPMVLLQLRTHQRDPLPVIKQGGTVLFASSTVMQLASWTFSNINGKCFPRSGTLGLSGSLSAGRKALQSWAALLSFWEWK